MPIDIETADALISRVTRSSAVAALGLVVVQLCKGNKERALKLAEHLATLSAENARDDLGTLRSFCDTLGHVVEAGSDEDKLRTSALSLTKVVERLESELREATG